MIFGTLNDKAIDEVRRVQEEQEQKEETIHDKYNRMSEAEKEIFTLGRVSVLEDFDGVCAADAFMGFTDDEFAAVKKFFAFNKAISVADGNI